MLAKALQLMANGETVVEERLKVNLYLPNRPYKQIQ